MTTRHLVPIIADIWSDVCSDNTHDQDVKAMLHALAGMGEALEETGYVLSGEAQADFERCGNEFLVFYRALHIEAKNTNTKARIKMPTEVWKMFDTRNMLEILVLSHIGKNGQIIMKGYKRNRVE